MLLILFSLSGMKTDSSEGAAGCSLLFASAVLGKAATLGHHGEQDCYQLVPMPV